MRSFNNTGKVKKEIQKAILKSLEEIGFFGEAEAKLRTPVKTGTLRRSISNKTGKNMAYIGTNVAYAEVVEKGSSKQKAQPYLTPAIEENTDKIKEIVERNFKEVGN